jgi:hypothetical protein
VIAYFERATISREMYTRVTSPMQSDADERVAELLR